ncbi:MAG TPA: UDP-N-acetylmuramate--L-alanine ligase, partial [Rhodospirillum rubrum]|nr:UDP-N-acetylmuramate--L-alanine ligase [Rhodospirillum rubrum]
NALGAIGIAAEMGIDDAVIRDGLYHFEGVKRRFTRTGDACGVAGIDDYGHHPAEIAAVLKAARDATARQAL